MRYATQRGLFALAARRGVTALLMLTVLAPSVAGPVLARNPVGSRPPAGDSYIPPRTPAQAAFERAKLRLVASVRAGSTAASTTSKSRDIVASPNAVCDNVCDGSGGSGGDGIGGGTSGGGTSGSGAGQPPQVALLEARARRQSENFWCGPASGQVVINYSRGFFFTSLNGDSTSTNWKTQAVIASWMKTTESLGTMGANLTAALNRPDAVLKPTADWSYLYATNSNGADMHAKIVTDIAGFAMPVVIAVKPHKPDADFYLPSWPKEVSAKHWITIYGYDGMWDGTDGPTLNYTESSGNGAKTPGPYVVDALTMWKVNQYNASTMVW